MRPFQLRHGIGPAWKTSDDPIRDIGNPKSPDDAQTGFPRATPRLLETPA